MKKIQILILTALFFFSFIERTPAQGWNQDRNGIYSVGVGGTQALAIGNGYPYILAGGFSLNVSGEYKIQRFVGLGFETGMDVFYDPNVYRPTPPPYPPAYASIGIPIAIKVNVHILEAANVPVADKLDVYAGLNLGGGPAFFTGPGGGVYGFMQAGPQVGIRYWLNSNIAIFGEFGWGATFANVGLTF